MKKNLLLFCVLPLVFWNCADPTKPAVSYVDPGSQGKVAGTGIESQDVTAAANQAAQSILNVPEIARAAQPPIIMITAVQNKSSSPVDTSLYTSILRDTLIANAGSKMRFLDRSQASTNQREQEMIDSGEVAGAGVPAADRQAATYDYILTAELQGIGMASGQGQSDYFRIAFKLVDRRTDLVPWTNAYQIKKEGRDSAVYR
jgi:penicillin-binding protein activator